MRAGNAVLETSVGKGPRLSAGISDVVAGVGGSPGGLPYFSHLVAGHLSVAMSPLPQDYNSARFSIEHLAPCGQHAVGAY